MKRRGSLCAGKFSGWLVCAACGAWRLAVVFEGFRLAEDTTSGALSIVTACVLLASVFMTSSKHPTFRISELSRA